MYLVTAENNWNPLLRNLLEVVKFSGKISLLEVMKFQSKCQTKLAFLKLGNLS